jgi:hypothetical protein
MELPTVTVIGEGEPGTFANCGAIVSDPGSSCLSAENLRTMPGANSSGTNIGTATNPVIAVNGRPSPGTNAVPIGGFQSNFSGVTPGVGDVFHPDAGLAGNKQPSSPGQQARQQLSRQACQALSTDITQLGRRETLLLGIETKVGFTPTFETPNVEGADVANDIEQLSTNPMSDGLLGSVQDQVTAVEDAISTDSNAAEDGGCF